MYIILLVNRNTVHAGRIRFQWWQDVIHDIYEGSAKDNLISSTNQTPVARALAYVIKKYNLSRCWFDRSLSARY